MHYLIIGNCAAGINAVEAIRKRDGKGEITVISDEPFPAYCRCLITNYLIGTHKLQDLYLREKSFYQTNDVNLMLSQKVVQVIPESKEVMLDNDKNIKYDKLLIATGASPKSLEIEGEDKLGFFCFRTLKDAENILELSQKTDKVLIFGGGLIGLKAAYALKRRGLDVEVIVKSPRILSQVVDEVAADLIAKWLIKNGIKIRTGLNPQKILGNKNVEGVILEDGQKIFTSLIIAGKGVSPNIGLIKGTSIKSHWGIVGDHFMQTTVKDVYTAGDVAETTDLVTGEPTLNALWTAASEQGRVAGTNMAGEEKVYPGSLSANSIEFFELPIISVGYVRVKEEGYEELVRYYPEKYLYKKVVLKDNRIVGVILVGKIDNAGVYTALIRRKVDITPVKGLLLEDWFDYAKVADLLEQKEGFRETFSLQGELIKTA